VWGKDKASGARDGFRNRPMVLETPKGGDGGEDMDAVNLAALRGLMAPA
jgi:hypothetical protein